MGNILLDMDGVLADFVVGWCIRSGFENLYDTPYSQGIWDMAEMYGISTEQFWSYTNDEEFWEYLPKTEECDDIVDAALSSGHEVFICTSPSLDPGSVTGKRKWMRRNFPLLSRRMVFTSVKYALAHENALLIDDNEDKCEAFANCNGKVCLVPRPWNYLVGQAVMPAIKDAISNL